MEVLIWARETLTRVGGCVAEEPMFLAAGRFRPHDSESSARPSSLIHNRLMLGHCVAWSLGLAVSLAGLRGYRAVCPRLCPLSLWCFSLSPGGLSILGVWLRLR